VRVEPRRAISDMQHKKRQKSGHFTSLVSVGSKGESRAARQPGLEAGAAVRADDGKVLCMRVNHIKPYDESQWQPLFFRPIRH
jgi:hypothetical protein